MSSNGDRSFPASVAFSYFVVAIKANPKVTFVVIFSSFFPTLHNGIEWALLLAKSCNTEIHRFHRLLDVEQDAETVALSHCPHFSSPIFDINTNEASFSIAFSIKSSLLCIATRNITRNARWDVTQRYLIAEGLAQTWLGLPRKLWIREFTQHRCAILAREERKRSSARIALGWAANPTWNGIASRRTTTIECAPRSII